MYGVVYSLIEHKSAFDHGMRRQEIFNNFIPILISHTKQYIPPPISSKLNRLRQKAWIGNSDINKHKQKENKEINPT
jgi:hypothetical protein